MGAGFAAIFLGALVPTFLVSRLLLWVTKRWNGGVLRLLPVHLISGALSCTASAYGHSDTGGPNWNYSAIYIVAQLVWLLVDIVRARRQLSQPAN